MGTKRLIVSLFVLPKKVARGRAQKHEKITKQANHRETLTAIPPPESTQKKAL